MNKTKNNVIKRIVLIIMCLVFIAGGVFATVNISKQNSLYLENNSIVEKYEENYENDIYEKFEQEMPGIVTFKEQAKARTEEARVNAAKAKRNKLLLTVCSVILYIAALACLVLSFVNGKSRKTNKE